MGFRTLRRAQLRSVQAYSLHGELYYHLAYVVLDEPSRVYEARLAHDAVYPHPQPGDIVEVETLLSMVLSVRLLDDDPTEAKT